MADYQECRDNYFGKGHPQHYHDWPIRSGKWLPDFNTTGAWHRTMMDAVIDALTSEGIPAWAGDATSCIVQIVEAYAKRVAELEKELIDLRLTWSPPQRPSEQRNESHNG